MKIISESREQMAASSGFISGILSALMKDGIPCIWIIQLQEILPTGNKKILVKCCIHYFYRPPGMKKNFYG